jgi:VCBS repeat-containing protein
MIMKKKIAGLTLALLLCAGPAAPAFAAGETQPSPMTPSVETSLFFDPLAASSENHYGGFVLKSNGELWGYIADKSGDPEKLKSGRILSDATAITSTGHAYVVAVATGTTTQSTLSVALALKTDGSLYVCAIGWGYDEPEPFFTAKQVDTGVAQIGGTAYLKINGELYELDPASKKSAGSYEAKDVIAFLPNGVGHITSDHTLHIEGSEYPGFRKIFGDQSGTQFALGDDGNLYGWGLNNTGRVGAGAVNDGVVTAEGVGGAYFPYYYYARIFEPRMILERVTAMYFDVNRVYACDASSLAPADTATRAEVAAMLHRFTEAMN